MQQPYGHKGARAMIRAFIVDDEKPAREELAYLLDETGLVELVGEASNVRDAVTLIKTIQAEVIFLDINMPGFSGLQLAEVLATHPNPPAVVFVTAYSEFAVKAFEVDAVDYILKPVDPERLRTALEKVRKGRTPCLDLSTRLTVTKGGKKHFISSADITYLMAKDDYSYIYAEGQRYLSTSSLTALEEKLAGAGFYRAHRRYLVNLAKIRSVEPQEGGTLELTIDDEEGTKIPVSRRRVSGIKKEMGL